MPQSNYPDHHELRHRFFAKGNRELRVSVGVSMSGCVYECVGCASMSVFGCVFLRDCGEE